MSVFNGTIKLINLFILSYNFLVTNSVGLCEIGVFLSVKRVRIQTYSVRIRKNADQNNSKYGHFSRSACWWYCDKLAKIENPCESSLSYSDKFLSLSEILKCISRFFKYWTMVSRFLYHHSKRVKSSKGLLIWN